MRDGLKRVLDYSDYLATPEDGKRYEILRGDLLVTPAPRTIHQRVLGNLNGVLRDYFKTRAAEVFFAPISLILTDNDILEPDLLVVDDPALVTDRGVEGPPLLIVEVLSKSTADHDRGVKARRYAELGVRHYWLVDPDERRVECHKLVHERARDSYDRIATFEGSARLSLPDFQGLDLPLAALWPGPPDAE